MIHGGSAVTRSVWCALLALALAFAPPATRQLRAFAVLARLTGMPLPAAAERWLPKVTEQAYALRGPGGEVRARRYVARSAAAGERPAVLLLHGAHPLGIEEPRLRAFARALAQGGLDVVTPELRALADFRLEAGTSTEIGGLAADLARRAHARAVGVIGISFAGGLALLAAAEQSGSAPVGCVVAVGAHQDLLRVGAYYARTDVRGPAGERARVPPHPYGARVLLRHQLAALFSAADLAAAERALDSYLHDRKREAARLAAQLSPAGRAVLSVLLDERGSAALDGYVLRALELEKQQLMAASPRGRLGALRVPVLLIHGEDDPVVPSLETRWLAQDVPARWLREALVTPLLRHAEFPTPPGIGEVWPVARFMRRMLEAAGGCQR